MPCLLIVLLLKGGVGTVGGTKKGATPGVWRLAVYSKRFATVRCTRGDRFLQKLLFTLCAYEP